METFPLLLKEGVKLASYDSVPVYIWDDTTAAADPVLLEWVPTSGATTGLVTQVKDLIFAGGSTAMDFTTFDGKVHEILVEDCLFAGNTVGANVLAEGNAEIGVIFRNCKIVGYSVTSAIPPDLDAAAVGLRFRAYEQETSSVAGFGEVNAVVNGLSTAGTFSGLATTGTGWYWYGSDNDYLRLPASIDGGTRLIEVDAAGATKEHRDTATTPWAAMPIAEVNLSVENSTLDGKSSDSTNGWDVGIYTSARINGGSDVFDYSAAYNLTVSSTSIKNLRLDGIYATVEAQGRGDVTLEGVDVQDVGPGISTHLSDLSHSGVHVCASDGYLRLKGTNSEFHDCAGDGVLVHVPESDQRVGMSYPTGGLLKLDKCELYKNGEDGLELAGTKAYLSTGGSASIGGTIDRLGSGRSIVYYPTKPGLPPDHGEGLVQNSQIYENGEAGIHVDVVNVFNKKDVVNVRFVNTYVYENAGIGYHAEIGSTSSSAYNNMYVLTPFVHCTFALNGSWSGKMDLVSGALPNFIWSGDPFVTLPFRQDPKTAFINSIFERTNASAVDFEPTLASLLEKDDLQASGEIGTSGCRFEYLGVPPFAETVETATPFAYLANGSLVGAERYFLDPTGTGIGDFVNKTTAFLFAFAPESSLDFEADLRPSPSTTDRDKGGDEL